MLLEVEEPDMRRVEKDALFARRAQGRKAAKLEARWDKRFWNFVAFYVAVNTLLGVAIGFMAGSSIWRSEVEKLTTLIVLLVIMTSMIGIFIIGLSMNAKAMEHITRALKGEREVQAQLAELERSGVRVMHDVQTGKFSVAHLVFHTSGIYAIETTATPYRKIAKQTLRENGLAISKQPHASRHNPTGQSLDHAAWLQEHITGLGVDFKAPVHTILACQGNLIDLKKEYPHLRVINPRELCRSIRKAENRELTAQQIDNLYSTLRADQVA